MFVRNDIFKFAADVIYLQTQILSETFDSGFSC